MYLSCCNSLSPFSFQVDVVYLREEGKLGLEFLRLGILTTRANVLGTVILLFIHTLGGLGESYLLVAKSFMKLRPPEYIVTSDFVFGDSSDLQTI